MKEINIALASDENYAPHMATNMVSICINNPHLFIRFHIADGGISESGKDRIRDIQSKYLNCQIFFYDISDKYIKSRFACGQLFQDRSLSAYSRLFLPEFIDDSIDRLIYLDADGIVVGSLEELITISMGNIVAGVLDTISVADRISVGLKPTDNYICSGMLLIDLSRWRGQDITNRLVEFVEKYNGQIKAMDQGAINGYFKGNIDIIHPKFNCMTLFYRHSSTHLAKLGAWEKYYDDNLIKEAIENPVFIHFTPAYTARPWQKHCTHPEKERYLFYRQLSGFRMDSLEADNRNSVSKILSILYHILPFDFFMAFVNTLKRLKTKFSSASGV